jgi:hypothetical protein
MIPQNQFKNFWKIYPNTTIGMINKIGIRNMIDQPKVMWIIMVWDCLDPKWSYIDCIRNLKLFI